MYNRYIPQPDGSYRRSRVEEPHRPVPSHDPPSPPPPPPPPPPPCREEPERKPSNEHQHQQKPEEPCRSQSTGSFLRQLLPQNFDTGDLMVIILLLLIAGDCAESRNNAILTLALYFIM